MKFTNTYTKTGSFRFEGSSIDFKGPIEAEGKLAKYLEACNGWECLEAPLSELDSLRAEAKELGLTIHHASKETKIREKIEAHKSGLNVQKS